MTEASPMPTHYVGWDVGGWNCDNNSSSRDAIVILDAAIKIVGRPWRGNLRETINTATTSQEWIAALFGLCEASAPNSQRITMAIDTPLGFSDAVIALASARQAAGMIGHSDSNPYLYRQTERYLFKRGIKPLSAVKDMIGSQATKGMHVLAKFAPQIVSCGVWSDGAGLTAIEGYPSPCRRSARMKGLRTFGQLAHDDVDDALTCALIASLFVTLREALIPPPADTPASEGWIWIPVDAIAESADAYALQAAPPRDMTN